MRERELLVFEWAARSIPGLRSRTERDRDRIYEIDIVVDHYNETRHVETVFAPYSEVPDVYVDGPGSPHRYGEDRLCMWHPDAPLDGRWVWKDGLLTLVGHIRAHLFREAWWREFDVWVGPEAPHGKPPDGGDDAVSEAA